MPQPDIKIIRNPTTGIGEEITKFPNISALASGDRILKAIDDLRKDLGGRLDTVTERLTGVEKGLLVSRTGLSVSRPRLVLSILSWPHRECYFYNCPKS